VNADTAGYVTSVRNCLTGAAADVSRYGDALRLDCGPVPLRARWPLDLSRPGAACVTDETESRRLRSFVARHGRAARLAGPSRFWSCPSSAPPLAWLA
jgi:hypothetical protein